MEREMGPRRMDMGTKRTKQQQRQLQAQPQPQPQPETNSGWLASTIMEWMDRLWQPVKQLQGGTDQQWQSPQQLQSIGDSSKGKGKGNSKRRQPKDDDTKKREIHFSNFPQMAAHKHMEFMIKMVEDFGLIEDIAKIA